MKFTLWATAFLVLAGVAIAGCGGAEEAPPADPNATPKPAATTPPADGSDPNAAGTAPAAGGGGGEMVATPKPLSETPAGGN